MRRIWYPYVLIIGGFALAVAFWLFAGLSQRRPSPHWPLWAAFGGCYFACVGIVWLVLQLIFQIGDFAAVPVAIILALPYMWLLGKTA